MQKIDMDTTDNIVFPTYESNHWYLVNANLREHVLERYDSYNGFVPGHVISVSSITYSPPQANFFQIIRDTFLQVFYKDKPSIDVSTWPIVNIVSFLPFFIYPSDVY
jgi:hypothetical protein